MSGTLLEIVNDALTESGFSALTSCASNTSDEARTMLALANRAGTWLASQGDWTYLYVDLPITLVAGQQTYPLPADVLFLVPDTAWNRDTRRSVALPMTPTEWQYYKAANFIQGLNLRARIIDGQLEIDQTIDASSNGQTIHLEYRSKYWCVDNALVGKQRFTADTDVSKHDRDLHGAFVRAYLKKQRGLDWQADMGEAMQLLRVHYGNDGTARTVSLGGVRSPVLGANIPDGFFGT
jgi:hypothetical protein